MRLFPGRCQQLDIIGPAIMVLPTYLKLISLSRGRIEQRRNCASTDQMRHRSCNQ